MWGDIKFLKPQLQTWAKAQLPFAAWGPQGSMHPLQVWEVGTLRAQEGLNLGTWHNRQLGKDFPGGGFTEQVCNTQLSVPPYIWAHACGAEHPFRDAG